MRKKYKKPINKVTTTNLDLALRLTGYKLDLDLIDKIIDLVEMLEDKGDDTTLMDIVHLEMQWKQSNP